MPFLDEFMNQGPDEGPATEAPAAAEQGPPPVGPPAGMGLSAPAAPAPAAPAHDPSMGPAPVGPPPSKGGQASPAALPPINASETLVPPPAAEEPVLVAEGELTEEQERELYEQTAVEPGSEAEREPMALSAQVYLPSDGVDLSLGKSDGLFWKVACKTGTLALSPGPGQVDVEKPLHLTSEMFRSVKEAYDDRAFPYVTVPETHANGPMENTGYVKAVEVLGRDELMADQRLDERLREFLSKDPADTEYMLTGIAFTEPEAEARAMRGSIPDTSVGIKFGYRNKTTGKKYAAAMEHVALTSVPWNDGMPPFGAAALLSQREAPSAGVFVDLAMARASTVVRNALPVEAFAKPEEREYPVHDERSALSSFERATLYGTDEDRRAVLLAVAQRHPTLQLTGGHKGASMDLGIRPRFDEDKVKRDLKGQFAKKVGGLKPGETAKLPNGSTVTRASPMAAKKGMAYDVRGPKGEQRFHKGPDTAAADAVDLDGDGVPDAQQKKGPKPIKTGHRIENRDGKKGKVMRKDGEDRFYVKYDGDGGLSGPVGRQHIQRLGEGRFDLPSDPKEKRAAPSSQSSPDKAKARAEREAAAAKAHPLGTRVSTTVHSTGGKSEKVEGEVVGHARGQLEVKTEDHGTIVVPLDKAEKAGGRKKDGVKDPVEEYRDRVQKMDVEGLKGEYEHLTRLLTSKGFSNEPLPEHIAKIVNQQLNIVQEASTAIAGRRKKGDVPKDMVDESDVAPNKALREYESTKADLESKLSDFATSPDDPDPTVKYKDASGKTRSIGWNEDTDSLTVDGKDVDGIDGVMGALGYEKSAGAKAFDRASKNLGQDPSSDEGDGLSLSFASGTILGMTAEEILASQQAQQEEQQREIERLSNELSLAQGTIAAQGGQLRAKAVADKVKGMQEAGYPASLCLAVEQVLGAPESEAEEGICLSVQAPKAEGVEEGLVELRSPEDIVDYLLSAIPVDVEKGAAQIAAIQGGIGQLHLARQDDASRSAEEQALAAVDAAEREEHPERFADNGKGERL